MMSLWKVNEVTTRTMRLWQSREPFFQKEIGSYAVTDNIDQEFEATGWIIQLPSTHEDVVNHLMQVHGNKQTNPQIQNSTSERGRKKLLQQTVI